MVQTAVGLPGRGDTAISVTASPGLSRRRVLRGPRPHRVKIWGISSFSRLATCEHLYNLGSLVPDLLLTHVPLEKPGP